MKKNLMTTVFVVLAAGVSMVGCGKTTSFVGNPNTPTPTNDGFVLTGRVLAEMDGTMAPLEGVDVNLTNGSDSRSTTTDADGVFVVGALAAGDWTVLLTKSGYAAQSFQVTVDGDTNLDVALALEDAPAPAPVRIRRK